MSRFNTDYDEYDPLASGRWEGNVRRAIKGRKGQAALRDLRDALLTMPERRLIAGEFATPDGEVCTVGCLVAYKRAQTKGVPFQVAAAELADEGSRPFSDYTYNPESGRWERQQEGRRWPSGETYTYTVDRDEDDEDDPAGETADRGMEAGLVRTLAWEMGFLNDEMWDRHTPEQRWAACLKWVEAQLIPSP